MREITDETETINIVNIVNTQCLHERRLWEQRSHLDGDGEPDEVDDGLLVGQLDGQNRQRGEEQLKVFVDVVLLFAAQVDVAVELLAVLGGVGGGALLH